MRKTLLIFWLSAILGTNTYAQWTNNISLNTSVASQEAETLVSAAAPGGKTYLAYYNPLPTGQYQLCMQLLDASGNRQWGNDGIPVGTKPTGYGIFVYKLKVDHDGNAILSTTDQRDGEDEDGQNLLSAVVFKIDQNGNSVWDSDGIKLGRGVAPNVTVLPNNDVIAAWTGESDGPSAFQKLKAADGSFAWDKPLYVSNDTLIPQGYVAPIPVATSTGDFYILSQKGVRYAAPYVSKYHEDGTAIFTNKLLSTALITSGSFMTYDIATKEGPNKDELFVCFSALLGANSRAVYLQYVDNSGNMPWGTNGVTVSAWGNDYFQFDRFCKYDSGTNSVVVVLNMTDTYQSLSGIIAQRIDIDGTRRWTDYGKTLYNPGGGDNFFRPVALEKTSDGFAIGVINGVDSGYYSAVKLSIKGSFLWNDVRRNFSTVVNPVRFNLITWGGEDLAGAWLDYRNGISQPFAQILPLPGLLPVRLLSFNGELKNNEVMLHWSTASEKNSSHFNVMRSLNGRDFTNVGTVNAAGNSTNTINYNWKDTPGNTSIVYYKIEMVDKDGGKTYSQIISFKLNSINVSIWPNPVTSTLHIQTSSRTASQLSMKLLDMTGKTVWVRSEKVAAGTQQIAVPAGHLAGGVYQLVIQSASGATTLQVLKK